MEILFTACAVTRQRCDIIIYDFVNTVYIILEMFYYILYVLLRLELSQVNFRSLGTSVALPVRVYGTFSYTIM